VQDYRELDRRNCRTSEDYAALIGNLAAIVDRCLSQSGKVVLIVGEVRRKNRNIDTAAIVNAVFTSQRKFRLVDIVEDPVPDVRRSRRGYAATKREWIMVFSRE
jgi:hypothetical protein